MKVYNLILIIILCVSGGVLSVHDWMYRSVTVLWLYVWYVVSALYGWYALDEQIYVILMLALVSCVCMSFERIRHKNLIGGADLIILPSFGFFIPLEYIPIFLSLTGIFAIIYHLLTRRQDAPLFIIFYAAFLILNLYTYINT